MWWKWKKMRPFPVTWFCCSRAERTQRVLSLQPVWMESPTIKWDYVGFICLLCIFRRKKTFWHSRNFRKALNTLCFNITNCCSGKKWYKHSKRLIVYWKYYNHWLRHPALKKKVNNKHLFSFFKSYFHVALVFVASSWPPDRRCVTICKLSTLESGSVTFYGFLIIIIYSHLTCREIRVNKQYPSPWGNLSPGILQALWVKVQRQCCDSTAFHTIRDARNKN